jgi:hypothetical protein
MPRRKGWEGKNPTQSHKEAQGTGLLMKTFVPL